jgi:hypothetical protein
MTVGADNNKKSAVGVEKMAVVAAAGAERQRLWWRRRLKSSEVALCPLLP